MRVQCLHNLKVGHDNIVPQGQIFDDSETPFPEFIATNMGEDFSDETYFKIIEAGETPAPKKETAVPGSQGVASQAGRKGVQRRK